MEKTHLLVDGNHLLHRVFHIPSLQALKSPTGELTGGVFGFLRSLRMSLEHLSFMGRCMVIWDGGLSKRRLQVLPSYKGNRHGPGATTTHEPLLVDGEPFNYMEEFYRQKSVIDDLLGLLRVKPMMVPGREADDVLAFYARVFQAEGDAVVVLSEDKDFYQLIDAQVSVYRPIAEEFVDEEEFKDQFGFPASRYRFYHAICGDMGDNIPGIHGAGPSTATAVLQHCSTLDEIYAYCDEHAHVRFRRVAQDIEVLQRNLKLVDMSKEHFSPLETRSLLQAATDPLPLLALETFAGRMNELGIQSITESITRWIEPFKELR